MIVLEDKEAYRNRYFKTNEEFITFVQVVCLDNEDGFNYEITTFEQAEQYLKDKCHYEYELKSKI